MANLNSYRSGIAVLVCLAVICACGGDEGQGDPPETPSSTPRRPGAKSDPWQRGTVIARDAGLHPELVVTGEGRAAVAYFGATAREDGLCDEIGGDDLPVRMLWDLWYAEERGTGFQSESIGEVLSFNIPQGLDMAVDPSGAPVVAALTGGPHVMLRFCSANDVGFYHRMGPDNWVVTTAVQTSGEAATGDAASDYGEVIGHWPGLAIDPGTGSAAIAYKDVHAGGIQNDDLERADLELALRNGGGWRALPVDWGKGAGSYNRALFDDEGRIVILSYNPTESRVEDRHGLWISRSSDNGQTWQEVRLLRAPQLHGASIALDPSGLLHVVYYDVARGVPVLVSQTDEQSFESLADGWQQTAFGDTRFDEGYHPSVAIDDGGTLAVAYYRCVGSSSDVGECTPAEDGLVFASRSAAGEFSYEVVDEGMADAGCGQDPSLAFESAGHPIIAYQCQTLEDGLLVDELHFARREAL